MPERCQAQRVDQVSSLNGAADAETLKLPSEDVMTDVCLGVTLTGLYTLVGLGVAITFM